MALPSDVQPTDSATITPKHVSHPALPKCTVIQLQKLVKIVHLLVLNVRVYSIAHLVFLRLSCQFKMICVMLTVVLLNNIHIQVNVMILVLLELMLILLMLIVLPVMLYV